MKNIMYKLFTKYPTIIMLVLTLIFTIPISYLICPCIVSSMLIMMLFTVPIISLMLLNTKFRKINYYVIVLSLLTSVLLGVNIKQRQHDKKSKIVSVVNKSNGYESDGLVVIIDKNIFIYDRKSYECDFQDLTNDIKLYEFYYTDFLGIDIPLNLYSLISNNKILKTFNKY